MGVRRGSLAAMPTSAPPFEPVLRFWLGEPGGEPLANQPLWFKKDPAFDAEVRERFGELVERGGRGGLEGWRATARGALAYVILLDQLPRNIHRGKPESFAHDARALEATLVAMARGFEDELGTVERWFLYMPLMHAEDLGYQERCVDAFQRLEAAAEGQMREVLRGAVDYAVRHRDVVARFGRFPHRNVILGRTSTPDEIEFLTQPGSSF